MPNWTEPQKNAIYATGGTLLVSAAAGSGKTSVLVQRIIGRITDEKHPCDIDELLVVTFSRLAAAEMRERLSNELGKRLAENPFDGNLHRQQRLLQRASIGTIDSFCNSVVKNNFQRLDISPDYRICDDGELKLIKSDAMSEVMERAYSEGGDAFLSLVEQFGDRRGDQKLENVIDRIYEYSTAYPFPEKVIDSFNEMYFSETEAGDTVWEEK